MAVSLTVPWGRTWRARQTEQIASARQDRLERAIGQLCAAQGESRISALARLIDAVRPPEIDDAAPALQSLQSLTERLREDAGVRAALRDALLWLLLEKQPLRLLCESGVLQDEGFFSGLWRRWTHRLLPEAADPSQLRDALHRLFPYEDDYQWVGAVSDECWIALLDAVDFGALGVGASGSRMPMQILEALQIVSYRIAAIGLEPELVRNYPAIERHESPFLTQNAELRDFIDERKQAMQDKRAPALDDKHLLVLLDQCDAIVARVHKQAMQSGASVSLTILLARLTQNLERLKLLLRLIEDKPAHDLNVLRVQLFKRLVEAENLRLSGSELWRQNTQLLAVRITQNASKTGEHYVTSTRGEYGQMLRSALGAGFIVSFMAMLKVALSAEPHAPIVAALLYSLNYGLGFVLIYLLGFTIATKQPAMTASFLAASLASAEPGRDRLDNLVEQIVRTLRSQFIAIVGNVALAFALPVMLGYLILRYGGSHYLSPEEARYLLMQQHPLQSLALFHAAIAGVCLFLAGLISGYFDNKAVYNRIPQRLQQLRGLRRLLGPARLERLAAYVENNLGALAGNFFFGCMLGSMGVIGFILGLPLDIRHITFSTAYFGYAMVALEWQVSLRLGVTVALGVLAIGLVNLAVSFGLALSVALRAQGVRFDGRRQLFARLLRRFLRRPQDFFWPPRDAVAKPPAPPGADTPS
jgi:site-specific recombinase